MSILNTGTIALQAFQRALATTSHNIANSATPGYSRQRVEMAVGQPQLSFIRRISDEYASAELRNSLSANANSETRANFSERLDGLLADSTTGLAPALEDFFGALHDVASDPTSTAARTVLLGDAESLTTRIRSLNERIEEERSVVNGQIRDSVDEINQFSQSLADLNKKIVTGYGQPGAAPNDLLDQRDQLLNRLAEKVDVRTTTQEDGSVNVFIGNGQSLVTGTVANQLVARPLSGDASKLDIGFVGRGSGTGDPINISRYLGGGEVGALMETRTNLIDDAQNRLGLISLTLSVAANEQNHLGLDQDGELGGDIFSAPDPYIFPETTNTVGGSPDVSIAELTELMPSDYRLQSDGTDFQLVRLSDNHVVTTQEDPPGSGILVGDGLSIDTSGIAGAQDGDRWLIQLTRFASGHLSVEMKDPAGVAAAAAVMAESDSENTGDGTLEGVRAIDAEDPNLLTAATLLYDGTNYTVDGVPPTSVATEDGITTIVANGWELQIRGTPAAGDQFTVGRNTGYEGDNRNMLALAELQDARLVGGDDSFEASYNRILADVGTRTQQAQVARDANATLLEQAQSRRDAIAGVNLDEEAADLLRFQQAYQAAAQVITVSNTLFESLLGAVR